MKSTLLTTMLLIASLSNKEAQAPQIALQMVAPDGTANNLEEYRRHRQALLLHFKGHSYPIQLVATTDSSLIVSYEEGVAVIGFNLAKGQPMSRLTIYEGQFDSRILASEKFELKAIEAAEKIYASSDISIAQDQANLVYIGKLRQEPDSKAIPARVAINETLMRTALPRFHMEID
ncbi:hypothetical protein [uncultured Shewanella sp.]|uniref:hypothetical protein n=1 Tax=Shewanella atlantica TaxID=271099 RepID=UPI0026371403|nr:hypothetical protein [uncultured Shewanella sp.]